MNSINLKPMKIAEGQRGYQVGNNSGSVLVERDAETFDWNVVDKLDRSLSSAELRNSYGVWTDQKSGGFLGMFKSHDGKIQEDEVSTAAFEPKMRTDSDSDYTLRIPTVTTRTEVSSTSLVVPADSPLAPRLETEWNFHSTTTGPAGGGCG